MITKIVGAHDRLYALDSNGVLWSQRQVFGWDRIPAPDGANGQPQIIIDVALGVVVDERDGATEHLHVLTHDGCLYAYHYSYKGTWVELQGPS